MPENVRAPESRARILTKKASFIERDWPENLLSLSVTTKVVMHDWDLMEANAARLDSI
jgi:hypothetical protein